MSAVPMSVPEGSVGEPRDQASWMETVSFCNGFCDWMDEEWSIRSQMTVKSTEPSEAGTALIQPSPKNTEQKNPTENSTRGSKRSKIHAFFKRAWKAIKRPFLCCRQVSVVSQTPSETPLSTPEAEPVPGPSGLQYTAVPEPTPEPEVSDCEPNTGSLKDFYKVENLLGYGGFGRVFKGIRNSDGKEVAIKNVRKRRGDRYISIPGCPKPLFKEVALMLLLRRPPVSPYVIEMYEWFGQPRVISLILEYPQPCKVLREFIISLNLLAEPVARGLMRQLVLALQHCIEHGVFHNDIHTDNILVNTNSLQLNLIDFGSAHRVNRAGYASIHYVGAVPYCPPEVFVKPRYHAVPTNVWALRVVMFMMVNGDLPFYTIDETLAASPSWMTHLTIECRDLNRKCLSRHPAARPTLEEILQHQWFRNQ